MADPDHLSIIEQGVEAWNTWRSANPDISPNLQGADLSGAALTEANLRGTDLSEACLRGAELVRTDLRNAELREADLSSANLRRAWLEASRAHKAIFRNASLFRATLQDADLTGADLGWADLRSTNLSWAILQNTDLSRTDLSEARFADTEFQGAVMFLTVFLDVDLSKAVGLEDCVVRGPCRIGIGTIFRSGTKVAESFLRRTGVPEPLISHIGSLVADQAAHCACFISHSTKDDRFCDRLHADMQARGVRCWLLPDAEWGKFVWNEIDEGTRLYEKLVVVCTENSLTSGPVLREISRALSREDREGTQVLFPIRIGDYVLDEWNHARSEDVQDKIAGDFTGWDQSDQVYGEALDGLIAALGREDG